MAGQVEYLNVTFPKRLTAKDFLHWHSAGVLGVGLVQMKMTCCNRSMCCLFATAFNQFFNRPLPALDACGLCRGHADGTLILQKL